MPALFELHWLSVHLSIDYKLCLLMHSATVQCCPRYISDIVQTTAASSRRQGLRFSRIHFHRQFHQPTSSLENRRFQWLNHQFGTIRQQSAFWGGGGVGSPSNTKSSFFGEGAGSPCNTKSPRLRPVCIPSAILIHLAVWPQ